MKKNLFTILVIGVVGAMFFGCAAKNVQPIPAGFEPYSFLGTH